MTKEYKISIYSPGDPSVGIFSQEWEITHSVFLEEEDIDDFKKSLKEAWEYISDDVQIILTPVNKVVPNVNLKYLEKYKKSKYKGKLIESLYTAGSGVFIVTEDGIEMVLAFENNLEDYSADYIICMLQNNPNVTVSKY